jgi:hypothetical protein
MSPCSDGQDRRSERQRTSLWRGLGGPRSESEVLVPRRAALMSRASSAILRSVDISNVSAELISGHSRLRGAAFEGTEGKETSPSLREASSDDGHAGPDASGPSKMAQAPMARRIRTRYRLTAPIEAASGPIFISMPIGAELFLVRCFFSIGYEIKLFTLIRPAGTGNPPS